MNDDKGTSVVLLNTEHGGGIFNSIAERIEQCESKIEYAVVHNPCIVKSEAQHPRRAEFFAEQDSRSLNDLIKKYCPFPPLHARIYRKIRGILGRVKRKLL